MLSLFRPTWCHKLTYPYRHAYEPTSQFNIRSFRHVSKRPNVEMIECRTDRELAAVFNQP